MTFCGPDGARYDLLQNALENIVESEYRKAVEYFTL